MYRAVVCDRWVYLWGERGRVMRFGTAIERLVDNYQYAKSKIWIRDEVAWALYHTWKEADDRKTEPTISN